MAAAALAAPDAGAEPVYYSQNYWPSVFTPYVYLPVMDVLASVVLNQDILDLTWLWLSWIWHWTCQHGRRPTGVVYESRSAQGLGKRSNGPGYLGYGVDLVFVDTEL